MRSDAVIHGACSVDHIQMFVLDRHYNNNTSNTTVRLRFLNKFVEAMPLLEAMYVRSQAHARQGAFPRLSHHQVIKSAVSIHRVSIGSVTEHALL
jgi:hypothetical protein